MSSKRRKHGACLGIKACCSLGVGGCYLNRGGPTVGVSLVDLREPLHAVLTHVTMHVPTHVTSYGMHYDA